LENIADRKAWGTAVLIAALVLGFYLFASSRTSLWDRDEPWYARTVMEMRESGNYLVPTFNGKVFTDKPVLFYWLMSGAMEVFGTTVFACRFWSAVGIATTCFLVFAVGRQLLGTKAGLWAMAILGTSLMAMGTGTLAIIDASLLPMMSVVMLAFVHALISRPRGWHALVMGVGLGLGMLAKGPIGLMPLPAMAVALYAARGPDLAIRRFLWVILAACAIGGLIFLTWAIPVSKATNGQFLRTFFGHDVFERALRPLERHGGNRLLFVPYYGVVTIVGFFPWTLYLPGALSALSGMRLGGRLGRAVLLGWIVPIPLVMTLAATKLPHYILFIWPGLALVTAAVLVAEQQNTLTRRDRLWLHKGGLFYAPVALVMSLGMMVGPWFIQVPGLRWSGLVAGAVLLATAVIALREHLAERFLAGAKVLFVGSLVLQAPLWLALLPALEQIKVTPAIGQEVNSRTAKDVPVASYSFGETSLNYYVGRYIQNLPTGQSVVDWAREAKPGILVIPKKDLEEIQRSFGALPLAMLSDHRGFNYSKGKPIEILAMMRGTEGR
jgi:4-amino-4-deoxy-L-arabinose transferase-like glycosyltransferase